MTAWHQPREGEEKDRQKRGKEGQNDMRGKEEKEQNGRWEKGGRGVGKREWSGGEGKEEGRDRRVTYYMALRVMRLKGNAPSSTRDTVTPGYHLVTTRNKPFL